jgi:beta-lactamase class A
MTATSPPTDARTAIEDAAAAAGVRVLLHALDVDSRAEVSVEADTPVVLASVFKVPVAVELARQFGTGRLDPAEQVVVPAAQRTSGPTGLSVLVDDVRMSLRDLAQLMISVSDNTATDVVAARVGLAAVNATMRELGLPGTVVEGDCGFLLGRLLEDLGLSAEEMEALAVDEDAVLERIPAQRWTACRDLEATATNRSTPREITRLLELIWTDRAAPAEQCAFVRRIMSQQVWPHRLRSGFPGAVKVSAKTGTLPFIRNEVGLVEYRDGGRYAVAVFTVARVPDLSLPAADAVIGSAARIAVDALRSTR